MYFEDLSKLAQLAFDYRPFRKSLGYFGWTGFENLGDEALYAAVKEALKPVIIYNHPRFGGRGALIQHALEGRYSGMLLGAGTLINTVGYLKEVRRLQKDKRRVFVFGAGVLDPKFQEEVAGTVSCLDEWVDVLRECAYVSVRGPHSKDLLESYGYRNAVISGDPAIFLARERIEEKANNKLVGINVGTAGKALWGSNERVFAFAIELCRLLMQKKYRIRLFSVWREDQKHVDRIARELHGAVEVVNIHVSHEEYMDKLRDVDLFIGEKLHAVVLAMCCYTPSIMLAYAPKCEDFMASIGFMDYALRTDTLQVDKALHMVDTIEQDPMRYQKRLFTALAELKARLLASAEELVSLV